MRFVIRSLIRLPDGRDGLCRQTEVAAAGATATDCAADTASVARDSVGPGNYSSEFQFPADRPDDQEATRFSGRNGHQSTIRSHKNQIAREGCDEIGTAAGRG